MCAHPMLVFQQPSRRRLCSDIPEIRTFFDRQPLWSANRPLSLYVNALSTRLSFCLSPCFVRQLLDRK